MTANNRESNSYTPRIRQAYFAYDDDNWHNHFSAGQMWSLLTQNRVGILNGTAAQATAAANTGLHPNNNIVFFSLRYYPFN